MEDESEDEYSDDDDMSWKVRRQSAKCLEAVISTRHELLEEFYRSVSPKLIARLTILRLETENTHCRGKHHCTARLQFCKVALDCFTKYK